MGFQVGDEVAASVELGGLLKGRVPEGTPGVVVEVVGSSYSVTFTIERDDLLVAHQTTLNEVSEESLTSRAGLLDPVDNAVEDAGEA